MLTISTERRRAWLAAISRANLTEDRLHNVYVCSRHFVKGLGVSLYNYIEQLVTK